MANLQKTKSEYLVELQQFLGDELDIISGTSHNFANSSFYGLLKSKYWDKEPFDDFIKRLTTLDSDGIGLFRPEEEPEDPTKDYEWEIFCSRINSLIEVIEDILGNLDNVQQLDSYQKLQILIPDKDITLLVIVEELLRNFGTDLKATLVHNEKFLLDDFKLFIERIGDAAQRISSTNNRIEMFDTAYDLEQMLGGFIESLLGKHFEWTVEQTNQANWFVDSINDFHEYLYFLLAIHEDQVVKLGLTDNQYIAHTTEIYDDRQDLMSEAQTLRDAGIAYSDKTEKNTNK